jgi:hypothetical protein
MTVIKVLSFSSQIARFFSNRKWLWNIYVERERERERERVVVAKKFQCYKPTFHFFRVHTNVLPTMLLTSNSTFVIVSL